MKKVTLFFVVLCTLQFVFLSRAFTQSATGKKVTWDNEAKAYYPNPVLLVHGLTYSAASAWNTAQSTLDKLAPYYSKYDQKKCDEPLISSAIINGSSPYVPYIQTYDYGGKKEVADGKWENGYYTFIQDIRDTSWGKDIYGNDLPNQTSLREAVEQVSTAYQTPDQQMKPVILVAHGLGGLMSRYYLMKDQDNAKVKRLITLATPHKGVDEPLVFQKDEELAINLFKLQKSTFGVGKGIAEIIVSKKVSVKTIVGLFSWIKSGYDLLKSSLTNELINAGLIYNFESHKKSQVLKDIMPGSGFLNAINGKTYPDNVEYVHTVFGYPKNIDSSLVSVIWKGGIKFGDTFASGESQQGVDVYQNINPVIARKDTWPWGELHFSGQTTNDTALLQGLDGIPEFYHDPVKKRETDKPNIAQGKVILKKLNEDGELIDGELVDMVFVQDLLDRKKTSAQIPLIRSGELFTISVLVGTKDLNLPETQQKDAGKEYLPAMSSDPEAKNITVKVNFDVKDRFVPLKTWNNKRFIPGKENTLGGYIAELKKGTGEKTCDDFCYIDNDGSKYALYEVPKEQELKNLEPGKYVYIFAEIENRAGLVGENAFVFKVQNSFDISCNVTRHCYEVQEKHSINLSIENKLSHSLTEAALFLYKKTDNGKILIAQHNGLLTINSGETYIWNIAETTALTAGEEEEHPLTLECFTNIDGEIKVIRQTVKPKVNKIVYYNMNHDGYIVEHEGDRVMESEGFIGLQFGKESLYLIHKHIFRRYCTFSIPDRYIEKSIDRMYLELYGQAGQAPNGFDLEIYESDYYADGTFSTADWSNYDAQIPGSQDTVYFPVNEAVEIEIDAKNALFNKYVSLEPLSLIFKKADEDEAPPPMDIGEVELKDLHLFEICLVVEFEDN